MIRDADNLDIRAHQQRLVYRALTADPGQLICRDELVRRVYGVSTPETRDALRQVIASLRRVRRDLEIETTFGWRVRPAPGRRSGE